MKKNNYISYYLPEKILSNEELAAQFETWSADKIFQKTGIRSRHIAGDRETSSDMAVKAAVRLFEEYDISPENVDFVVLATQSPDYALPSTSCIIQDRLGIPQTAGAFDVNLGCSAYIYTLAVAKGLICAGCASKILLIMSETYTKHINPKDKSVRTIFGDGAAAVLITKEQADKTGEFVLGTDGSGFNKLIIPASGQRIRPCSSTAEEYTDRAGNVRSQNNLFMDGAEIFNFTIKVTKQMFDEVLKRNHLKAEDIDLFVFHQANKFMLEHLRKMLDIPVKKFYINIENTGNTVSATIPIALKMAENEGKLKEGDRVMLMGFGVGLSYGAVIIKW